MIELRVSASDGFFSGLTQIYTTWEGLSEFTARLQGFPRTTKDMLEDINGAPGGYSYLRLVFRCINGAGHVATEVEMEQNQALVGLVDIRAKAMLGFLIEPLAIDSFVSQLQSMTQVKKGSAKLIGCKG